MCPCQCPQCVCVCVCVYVCACVCQATSSSAGMPMAAPPSGSPRMLSTKSSGQMYPNILSLSLSLSLSVIKKWPSHAWATDQATSLCRSYVSEPNGVYQDLRSNVYKHIKYIYIKNKRKLKKWRQHGAATVSSSLSRALVKPLNPTP